tara:strand:- start:48488 stop:48736 length:249 start_codon:yes stop_codon:yes gene_type:complete
MNIPCKTGDPRFMSMAEEANQYQYKEGHRDARHAAAELSLKYERALEQAMEALKEIVRGGSDYDSHYCELSLKGIENILKDG